MEFSVKFYNCCPHDVVIILQDGSAVTFNKCDTPARVYNDINTVFNINKVPILQRSGGNVINLPEPQDGVLYIVSEIVQKARPDRADLLCPGPTIKNEFNVILGCSGLMLRQNQG